MIVFKSINNKSEGLEILLWRSGLIDGADAVGREHVKYIKTFGIILQKIN